MIVTLVYRVALLALNFIPTMSNPINLVIKQSGKELTEVKCTHSQTPKQKGLRMATVPFRVKL